MRNRKKIKINESQFLSLINESYGFFDGCRELAEEIFEKVYENWHGRDNLTQRDYFFVPCEWASSGRIVILPTREKVRAGYVHFRDKVLGDTVICINPKVIYEDESSFLPTLEHELTHAYEDSMRINNGTPMHDAAIKSGYDKLSKYRFKGAHIENDSVLTKDLSNVLYVFASFEENAFFAAMFGKLIHGYSEPENANECLDALKETNEYYYFSKTIDVVREILTKKDDKNEQENLVKNANSLTNMHFSTYNQLCKWLNYKADKLERRMNNIIPKMVKKYFEMIDNGEI